MATIVEKRATAVEKARNIALSAKSKGVDLTPAEISDIDGLIADIKDFDVTIAKSNEARAKLDLLGVKQTRSPEEEAAYKKAALTSEANRDPLGNMKNGWTTEGRTIGDPEAFIKDYYAKREGAGNMSDGIKATDRTAATRRTKAQSIGNKLREHANAKGMFAPGSIVEPVAIFDRPVLLPGEALLSLASLLETKVLDKGQFSYIRQTTRDNNAAPVALGAEKPVSAYAFEEITGELKTIATLSEPLHNQWLWDHPEVITSMTEEMLLGLIQAEDEQLLNGNGTSPNLRGLINAVGAQVQLAGANDLATLRSAVTKLEVLNFLPSVTVLNPLDWERIELQTNAGTGEYTLAGGPVDRAARRIWGVPVLAHTAVPAGTAVMFDSTAAHVLRGKATHVDAAPIGEDFQRNQVHIRIEERLELAVTKPMGIVKITLPVVTP